MKFKFKIQQYQTDAVDAVVKVFGGQPFQDRINFRRDVGKLSAPQQIALEIDEDGEAYIFCCRNKGDDGKPESPSNRTSKNFLCKKTVQ